MSWEKAREINGSREVLMHPSGEYNLGVLEKILSYATIYKLDKNEIILTTHEQRVKNFDPDNPNWEKITYPVPLQKLFELYNKIEGREYKEPTLDELKSRNKLGFKY